MDFTLEQPLHWNFPPFSNTNQTEQSSISVMRDVQLEFRPLRAPMPMQGFNKNESLIFFNSFSI
jgi:hypothetical protein